MADGRRVLDSILSEFDTAEREAWLNRARLYGSGPLREAIAARDRAMPSSNITRSGSSGFDINKFLRELPRVEEKDFPREPENVCSICHIVHAAEDPDTGYTEFPVRLPCGHIIGKACICKWLKKGPEGSNANNCPIVSTSLIWFALYKTKADFKLL